MTPEDRVRREALARELAREPNGPDAARLALKVQAIDHEERRELAAKLGPLTEGAYFPRGREPEELRVMRLGLEHVSRGG